MEMKLDVVESGLSGSDIVGIEHPVKVAGRDWNFDDHKRSPKPDALIPLKLSLVTCKAEIEYT